MQLPYQDSISAQEIFFLIYYNMRAHTHSVTTSTSAKATQTSTIFMIKKKFYISASGSASMYK